MPICDRNFKEKDSVTSWAPTNNPSPIWTLGQPLIFGFETIRTIGTCIQLVTTKSMNFFRTFEKVGPLRSYENFHRKKTADVAEANQRHYLTESEQWLEIYCWILASGGQVLQKVLIAE